MGMAFWKSIAASMVYEIDSLYAENERLTRELKVAEDKIRSWDGLISGLQAERARLWESFEAQHAAKLQELEGRIRKLLVREADANMRCNQAKAEVNRLSSAIEMPMEPPKIWLVDKWLKEKPNWSSCNIPYPENPSAAAFESWLRSHGHLKE